MHEIVRSRFRPADWNIYAAQASDGDNSISDGAVAGRLLTEMILPVSQFFAYLEVGEANGSRSRCPIPPCGRCISVCAPMERRCRCARSSNRSQIFPVFHDLFQRRRKHEKAAP
jgi:uncharacterized protein